MRYVFLVLLAFLLTLLFSSPRDVSGFQLTSWTPYDVAAQAFFP